MKDLIYKSLYESRDILVEFITPEAVEQINNAATMIAQALRMGGKVISCGNGGSLCDAAHFAEELTGRFRKDRKPYPAIAINDSAYITCVGNDYSFDEIFSRYVEAIGKAGDILLAISTSGNSKNVIRAAEAAKTLDMHVISLTRAGVTTLSELSDIALTCPDAEFSDRIQEIHIKIIHILIQAIEANLGRN
ncbi:MAG: D-sedoheptulose 7-phosphate isomerase [Tannerella sp.]|jgi:D-sedoheptulose 7-phosphate isomerase|nr:D-sedoheptulose 7-phosphate isomerase [Tannerella sp.]